MGAYALCKYFAEHDHEEFESFLHMTVDAFNQLHQLALPHLTKQRTHLREPISSEIRLAITLQ